MAKLVLDIEPGVIDTISKIAEKKNQSISQVAEDLFKYAAAQEVQPTKIRKNIEEFSPWIQQLVLAKEPTPDFDHKAEYGKHLEEKYGL